jgi:NodT family efflux transporter outer membrane factor (OMF) lipoprotein
VSSARGALFALLCVAPLAGCAVGPDFKTPAAPKVEHYEEQAPPEQVGAGAAAAGATGSQRLVEGGPIASEWWRRYQSADLDALVASAFAANPTVLAAQATLREAHESTAATRGAYFPQASAGFSAARQRNPVEVLSPTLTSGAAVFNLYTPQVTVSYVPDVFGANRRLVESAAAQEEAARQELAATYLTLAGNVVTAAVQEAGLSAQLAATDRVISVEREALEILKRQYQLGAVAEADVLAQAATLAALETARPALDKQLAQQRHALAVLTGRLPSDPPAVQFRLDDLKLPAEIPLGVPSELVRRRPDVRAAEAQLHAATAQVGVATANLLPQITLTAGAGSTATEMASLFTAGTGFWTVGASLSQTLFAGGTLVHRRRAAVAALDAAGDQYRAAVLTAFQNVADALRAVEADAAAEEAARRAAQAAEESLGIARHMLELGAVSYLALVLAEQSYQQNVLALVQAQTNRLLDTAALFQALGGSAP